MSCFYIRFSVTGLALLRETKQVSLNLGARAIKRNLNSVNLCVKNNLNEDHLHDKRKAEMVWVMTAVRKNLNTSFEQMTNTRHAQYISARHWEIYTIALCEYNHLVPILLYNLREQSKSPVREEASSNDIMSVEEEFHLRRVSLTFNGATLFTSWFKQVSLNFKRIKQ